MSARTRFLALLAACSLTAAATARADWPHDPYGGGLPVCNASDDQWSAVGVSDGAGGAIFVWEDRRTGAWDLQARRVSATGTALWPANGVPVVTATATQRFVACVPDGAGGVIAAWEDYRSGAADIYVQRLDANGTALWTANGVGVCTQAASQVLPTIASDGAGGAIIAWQDFRGADGDIYAQRVNASGAVQWIANGVAVCTSAGIQHSVKTCGSAGGVFLAWSDERGGAIADDVYMQRLSAAGAAGFAVNGLPVSASAGSQFLAAVEPDGTGGMLVLWQDTNSGKIQLRAQRMSSNGLPQWANGGMDVATSAFDQQYPSMRDDGSGGMLLSWGEARGATLHDVYAQRISAGGTQLWGAAGVALCLLDGEQWITSLVPDAGGGAIVTWSDRRGGTYDLYAQRVSATGSAQWTGSGTLVAGSGGDQASPVCVEDARGGVIALWQDDHLGNSDLDAQGVDHHGMLGDVAPRITSVKDVPSDQGGKVKLSWSASSLDEDPTFGIFDYRIWRSVPQAALAAGLAARRGTTTDSDVAAETGMLLVVPNAAADYAWELVTTQSAAAFPSYSLVVVTVQDSTPGYAPRTAFMVEARQGTSVASKRWSSVPDSGYSVDNLAPAAPAPFTAQYSAGTARLHWQPNHEDDLAGYRLYRGTNAAFAPTPAALVSAPPDTGYADAAGAPYFYKLTAVDAHGNESPVALTQPTGTLGVDGSPLALSFAAPWPQPARSGVAFRFALPARGEATLELFDAAGRRVAVLADGPHEAGEHTLRWDGRDGDGGRVAPGLYLARLTAAGRPITRRVVTAE